MEFIVDVQGFEKPNNQFVSKDLAIVPLQEDALPLIYLFEPPCYWNSLPSRYKSENLWLTRIYHGIGWTSGDIPYMEVRPTLQDVLLGACAIYVKGVEKKKWFVEFGLNARNLEDMDCPSLKKLNNTVSITCHHHTQFWSHNCAVRNVLTLKTWFLIPQDHPTIRIYDGSSADNDDADDTTKSVSFAKSD